MNDKRNSKQYCQGYIDCHTSYSNALNQASYKNSKPTKEAALKILDAIIMEVHLQAQVAASMLERITSMDKPWNKLKNLFKAE